MRKITIPIVLLFCLLVGCPLDKNTPEPGGEQPPETPPSAGPGGEQPPVTPPPPISNSSWAVLVHFAIDNDLGLSYSRGENGEKGLYEEYLEVLEAIEAADPDNRISICVLMDDWTRDSVTGFQDGYYFLTGGEFEDDLVVLIEEINSGDVADTRAFMDWAVANHPGNDYMYVIYSHGDGFLNGTGNDQHELGGLLNDELSQTTAYMRSLIGKKIDLYYLNACLMGGVEVAYELRDTADYVLFSEDSFPIDNFSYEPLSVIIENGSVSAQEIGRAFCDGAYDHFSQSDLQVPGFVLALADLNQIDELYTAIDVYAKAAITDLHNNNGTEVGYYFASDDAYRMNRQRYVYYIDLVQYFENIFATELPRFDSGVYAAARSVLGILDETILYMREYDRSGAGGMNIFHNLWGEDNLNTAVYRERLDFGANAWADYIDLMDTLQNSPIPQYKYDQYELDGDNVMLTTSTVMDPGGSQRHTIHSLDDVDFIKIDLSASTVYRIHCSQSYNIIQVSFYGPDENLIEPASSDSNDFEFVCPESGTYYLMIEGGDNIIWEYTIGVSVLGIVDNYLDNPGDALELTIGGGPVDGSLDYTYDQDWYYFVPREDGVYTVNVDGESYFCYIYDEESANGGLPMSNLIAPASSVEISAAANNTYYIEITMLRTSSQYTVSVSDSVN